jgi:hypothetical protein
VTNGLAEYRCRCGWSIDADLADWRREQGDELQLFDDGRIRSPEDVAPRIEGTLATAAEDARLSERDRDVLGVLVRVGLRHTSIYAIIGREWLAVQVGATQDEVRGSLRRLERFGYVRKWTRPRQELPDRVREQLEDYPDTRPPNVYEILKSPTLSRCAECGRTMRATRSTRTTCSDSCRIRRYRRGGMSLDEV